MANQGWIKLHRKIRDNELYKNSKALHCWIECLLRANHKENTFYLGRQKLTVKEGQFIFGRKEFGESVGLSPSTAYFWILKFKVDSLLDIKNTNKYSVITIKKWKEHQQVDIKVDSRKTADEQQKNTNNNIENVKNDKTITNSLIPLFKEINPSYEQLYRNITQRDCLNRLIKKYGEVWVTNLIKRLPEITSKPYAPRITTPYELETKLGQLKVFLQQEKSKATRVGSIKV